ncbi:MAG: prepilin-type N-terminal cleavage/methylation domain-containing protein [Chthoniobacterales bacterium]|nr:prepilin-type N-terminal cleavage/methylation domain-containing protein [Chthoniobacterales bacterium]
MFLHNFSWVKLWKCSGFTLFEALIALAVFGFAVVGLMMAFDELLDAAREIRRESVIRNILEDRIAWLEEAELQKYENRIEGPLPDMVIYETIEPEQLTDSKLTIYEGFWRCRVKIEWKRESGTETLEGGFLRMQM